MTYRIILTEAAMRMAASISTPVEVERQVREEIDQIIPDLPNRDINQLMFHTVFVGSSHNPDKCVPLICIPRNGELMVDTATHEDMGEINRADGLFAGKRIQMPNPDTIPSAPDFSGLNEEWGDDDEEFAGRIMDALKVEVAEALRLNFRARYAIDSILTDEEIRDAGSSEAMKAADDAKRAIARIGASQGRE